MKTQTSQFKQKDKVIYRLKVGSEVFDIRASVIDVIHSQKNGYSYQLSLPKGSLSSDIIPEDKLRLDTTI